MPMTGSGSTGPKQFFIPYNGKIADITHADTNTHYLNLATALSETRKIISVLLSCERIAGTGLFRRYPNEGATRIDGGSSANNSLFEIVIADGTNRLQYALSVANDDWDLYCFGYVVEA